MEPTFSLMYHDVRQSWDRFLFPNERIYCIEADEFERHLDALQRGARLRRPSLVTEPSYGQNARVYLTFDDGRESAIKTVAPMLERRGWRGHFFVISRCIGRAGYLSSEHIAELAARGHVIGTHSATHPERFGRLSSKRIALEWRASVSRLSEVIGKPVVVGSVPHGDFTPAVASLAADAGIEFLFTSAPTSRATLIDDCRVLGRFTIFRGMSPERVAGIVMSHNFDRFAQAAAWKVKKIAKRLGGTVYLSMRSHLISAFGS